MKSWLLMGAMLVLVGCATTSDGVTRDRNRITAEEIADAPAANAFDLVQRLRPSWLRVRGAGSIHTESPIRVYVDGMSYGNLSSLRQISISDVVQLERLGAADATQRFGTGHTSGVILVYTH